MSPIDIELRPVSHITTDAIGQPGQRVFYIQAWQAEHTVCLIIEKLQIQSLAIGLEQFLAEIQHRFPDLPEAENRYEEDKMHILPPVDPLFRVGEIGMGYDQDGDLIVLVLREQIAEGEDVANAGVVRFWATRSQLRQMAHWGLAIASRGRINCPQCGEPMDLQGHFCPKKNGHKH